MSASSGRRAIGGDVDAITDMRTVLSSLLAHASAKGTRYCAFVVDAAAQVACGAVTREGKPFCSDHVEEHDYVRDLLAQIEQREREEQLVLEHGAKAVTDRTSLLADVVRELVMNGDRTIPRLRRDTNLPEPVVCALVRHLRYRGVVTTSTTTRGVVVVRLVHPQRATA
jgi:hypothetical protein